MHDLKFRNLRKRENIITHTRCLCGPLHRHCRVERFANKIHIQEYRVGRLAKHSGISERERISSHSRCLCPLPDTVGGDELDKKSGVSERERENIITHPPCRVGRFALNLHSGISERENIIIL